MSFQTSYRILVKDDLMFTANVNRVQKQIIQTMVKFANLKMSPTNFLRPPMDKLQTKNLILFQNLHLKYLLQINGKIVVCGAELDLYPYTHMYEVIS